MSLSTVQVLSLPAVVEPRGAQLVDLIHSAFIALFRRPSARTLTRAEEAAPVRAMARQLQDSDPGFASDLTAAAMRHESLDDDPSR